jgi:tripartite-type tricarboxylate transporter receptor subunit TctC
MHRRTVVKALAALPALSVFRHAQGQGSYPDGPVRVVVPFPPGSAVDIVTRITAQAMGDMHGYNMVVENKAGASGVIGLQYALTKKADGYTLIGGGLGTILPIATMTNLPIDIAKSIVPIAQVADFANVIVVGQNSPYTSLQQLLEAARKSTDRPFTCGANDRGSSPHLATELFMLRTDTKMTYVPYRGPNEIIVDLVNGGLELGISSLPSYVSMIRGGRLRALAVTSRQRSKHLPEVPTAEECGVKDFNVTSWLGLYGLPGTPAPVLDQLTNDVVSAMSTPQMAAKIEGSGFEATVLGSADFAKLTQSEIARWSDLAKKIGLQRSYGNV